MESSSKEPQTKTPDTHQQVETYSTHRIIALSDGVFAIVMTILILGLKIGSPSGPVTSDRLAMALLVILGKIEGYIATFLALGIFWIEHNEQFRYIRRATKKTFIDQHSVSGIRSHDSIFRRPAGTIR